MARARRASMSSQPSSPSVPSGGRRHAADRRAAKEGLPLADAPSTDRGRQIQRTMTGGALGGGALLAGFGLVPGIIGAVVGAALGYLYERSVADRLVNRAA